MLRARVTPRHRAFSAAKQAGQAPGDSTCGATPLRVVVMCASILRLLPVRRGAARRGIGVSGRTWRPRPRFSARPAKSRALPATPPGYSSVMPRLRISSPHLALSAAR
jgi:hypothetical protein